MERIAIIGSGGHARSVVDAIEADGVYEIAGFIGPDRSAKYHGYKVICDDNNLYRLLSDGICLAAFGMGYLGGRDARKGIFENMKKMGFKFPSIIDRTAIVALDAVIREGAFVGKRAIVNSSACIGALSIVNSAAVVEHDCIVGDRAHVSVGAILCGGVHVGEGAFIGAGATVIQSLRVGAESIVGAGSTVLKDVPEGGKALGVYV